VIRSQFGATTAAFNLTAPQTGVYTVVVGTMDAYLDGAGPYLLTMQGNDAGSELIQNGGFDDGMDHWQLFATPNLSHIVSNVSNSVFQFYRVPAAGQVNEAVVLQATTMPLPTGTAVEAAFDLGNSDTVRKRFKVLIHDLDFTDSQSCTFFLDANAPLRTFTMRTHTTRPWTNTTISFYASTGGSSGGFYLVDNVSLRVAPAGAVDETECVDPLVPAPPGGPAQPSL
jgi:hypothetical protein